MVGRGTRTLAGVIDGLATAEERKAAIAASAKPSFVIHDITDSSRCHKLCSALDVLSEQTGTAKAKVTQQLEEEEVGLEEIDKAVADEMEAERQQAKLHREAERKRRERLVVGVEWDSEDRDPFADPDREDARRREWRCPFGKKWRGQPMKVVDQGWIEWALREAKLTPMWRKVFTEELDRRKNAARFETPSQAQFRRQLEEGRRYAAKVRASDGE